MAKDRKITQENKHFYRLGFMNGENKLQQTITMLRKANRHLWDELTRLDVEQPKRGVLIDRKTFGQVIKYVTKKDNKHLLEKLQRKQKQAEERDIHNVLMCIS